MVYKGKNMKKSLKVFLSCTIIFGTANHSFAEEEFSNEDLEVLEMEAGECLRNADNFAKLSTHNAYRERLDACLRKEYWKTNYSKKRLEFAQKHAQLQSNDQKKKVQERALGDIDQKIKGYDEGLKVATYVISLELILVPALSYGINKWDQYKRSAICDNLVKGIKDEDFNKDVRELLIESDRAFHGIVGPVAKILVSQQKQIESQQKQIKKLSDKQ